MSDEGNEQNGLAVIDNKDEQQYEVHTEGKVAVLTYERHGKRVFFLHTEVPPALEGHGIAGTLARAALEDARREGMEVVPLCPYVAAYIRRHREYLPLVEERHRDQLLANE